jgi:hypothetical protein
VQHAAASQVLQDGVTQCSAGRQRCTADGAGGAACGLLHTMHRAEGRALLGLRTGPRSVQLPQQRDVSKEVPEAVLALGGSCHLVLH